MSFHLTVAGSLEPLADAVADLLSRPHPDADPFRPELVIVPSAGVRSWLNARLAERLGATARGGDGIAANLEYRFPDRLLSIVLGDDATRPAGSGAAGQVEPRRSPWHTGPLTWTVFDELVANAAAYAGSGVDAPDAVRSRSIADLFDRYTLHRQAMVNGWSRGTDELGGGRDVGPADLWQPALWRAARARTGGTTDAEQLRDRLRDLRAGRSVPDAPPRIVVFGLASLPPPHLEALGALSMSRELHVLAPVPSGVRWQRLVDRLPDEMELPIARDDPSFPVLDGNPLVTEWGRSIAEAHALLHLTAVGAGASIDARFVEPVASAPATLLARVQRDIATDAVPAGAVDHPSGTDSADEVRLVLDGDRTVQWHRCFGEARQVEVLRDAILHLLAETDEHGVARFRPRDIVVFTTDIARHAPLVDAVFAGDEHHGVPRIPLEVADRTLRQDNRLVDALLQLFDLTEGRFRASDLLRFITSPVVGRRFGLDADAVDRITTWVHAANVRWGIDGDDLERFGVPRSLDAFTWRAAIDRLLLGSTLPDGPARLGPGGIPPEPGIEGADVVLAGRLSELVRRLSEAVERLTRVTTVHDWCAAVAVSIAALFRVDADDAGASRPIDLALTDLEDDAAVDGAPVDRAVDPRQLATLLRTRLESGSSRPRFDTGAVTLSSLTAQRGVPYRAVFLLGLDDEVGSVASVDDLVALRPCIGDRDARSEQRAQLLDAVLAAGERFVVLSNGRDVRSNTPLPPVSALAEFLDVLDATAVGADGRAAREVIAVDHPRQAWSESSFVPGGLGVPGPWGFDTGARDAVLARERQTDAPPFLAEPIPMLAPVGGGEERVSIPDLVRSTTTPVRSFLAGRLGVRLPDETPEPDDSIPFVLDGLSQSALDRSLLAERLGREGDWTSADARNWRAVVRRRGQVPPELLGDVALGLAETRVHAALRILDSSHPGPFAPESVPVRVVVDTDAGPVLVEGTIEGVSGDVLYDVRVTRAKVDHVIDAWVRVALLTLLDPTRPWRAVLVSRHETKKEEFVRRDVRLSDPSHAATVVRLAVDLWRRAQCDAIPLFPATSRALTCDPAAAPQAWDGGYNVSGESDDDWNRIAFDLPYVDLARLPVRPYETTDEVIGRVEWWARQLWSVILATTVPDTETVFDSTGAPK